MNGLLDEQTAHFVSEHRRDDVRTLALSASRYPGVDMPRALEQIAGWQMLERKVPSWAAVEGLLLPPKLPLEQCSSQATATYKARLVGSGKSLADLTGGLGIDCTFMGQAFEQVTYVERQEWLCRLARHNFPLLGLRQAEVTCGDAAEMLDGLPPVDCIFLDPARRDSRGGKVVAVADCEPDVSLLEPRLLAKARRVLVKLSPMLDLALALHTLRHVAEAHVVAVDGECKELLLLLRSGETAVEADDVPVHCVNLASATGDFLSPPFVFTRRSEQAAGCHYAVVPRAYLYEPDASLLKAGAFRSVAVAYGLEGLHPNSHLYTSDSSKEGFPGRVFRVEGCAGFGKRELTSLLGGLRRANLTVRNFPASVAELRRRLKLAEGGTDYLFATTLADGRKALLRCTKA